MKSSSSAFAFAALALALPACGSCRREVPKEEPAAPTIEEDAGRSRFFRPEPDFRRDGGFRLPRHRRREAGVSTDPDAVAPAAPIE